MVESSFFDRVVETIRKYDMLRERDSVLVAVSGGPDSMALLHVLNRLQTVFDIKLTVFHLNHLLRGREAGEDARFVAEYAESLAVPVILEEFDVPALMKREKLSLEEAAREARYRAMERTAARVGAGKVALGHHADDQVETFLMRLLRGAGLEGLSAIQPVRGVYVRPLIEVDKEDILAYLAEQGLGYRIDASNEDLSILRNRIRNELIPYLGEYNPQVMSTLLNTIELVREDRAFIEAAAAALFEEIAISSPGSVRVESAGLVRRPLSLQRRVLRRAIHGVKGDLRGIEFKHIEAILAGLRTGSGRIDMELPGGIIAATEYEWLVIAGRRYFEPPSIGRVELAVPGTTRIDALDIDIEAEYTGLEGVRFERHGNVAHLDAARVTGPLTVRLRAPGDSFRPYGMIGEKKLQDLFVDEKISKRERNRVPIIESDGKIAWVAGFRIDDSFKVTETTRRVLVLRLIRRGT